ncbi:MAG: hypothetical protein ACRYFW_10150 [Janthinobacterium lividum]
MPIVPARHVRLVPILALVCAATGVSAQNAGPAPAMPMDMAQAPCPATPATLPPEFSAWTNATPVAAAATPADLAAATIEPGHGVQATLTPAARITYPVVPGHPGEPGTSGGLFAFAVSQAGNYRVALGAGAWIDVVRDKHAIASTAHGHGPACSAIRKTVDFALAPGRYLLEVSGNRAPTLALMIAVVPH